MHTASLVLRLLQLHPVRPAVETDPALSLPLQRRLVDTIASRITAVAGMMWAVVRGVVRCVSHHTEGRMNTEVLQSQVCVQYRELYIAAVGQAPGAWLRFLVRHGDALHLGVDDHGKPFVALPHSA